MVEKAALQKACNDTCVRPLLDVLDEVNSVPVPGGREGSEHLRATK